MNTNISIITFLFLCQTLLAQSFAVEVQELLAAKNYLKLEGKLKNHLANYPKDYKMLESLGDVYGYQSKWEEALMCYESLLKVDSLNAEYYYKAGGVLGRLAKEGSKLSALKRIRLTKFYFKKAETIAPDNIAVQWAQVQLYAELPGILGGSYDISWTHAEKLAQLSIINGDMAKIYILTKQDKWNEAKPYAQKIFESTGIKCCVTSTDINNNCCKDWNNSLYFALSEAYFLFKGDLNVAQLLIEHYLNNYTTRDRYALEEALDLKSKIKKQSLLNN